MRNHNVLKHVSLQSGFVLCMILVNSAICNYFFTKEIEKEKRLMNMSQTNLETQITLILLFVILAVLCLYRVFTVHEFYQQVISGIGLIISLIFSGLLLWGINFLKNHKKQ
uniref:Immunity protein BlpL n=1 Tax=Streptococcus uberis TaxID=1349 RepID=A0A8F2XW23_STRUB|nr:hypothetical protein MDIKOOEB_00013 [Streptococcus uberis]